MGLVIRKKVTLEFLGDEYKDAYLVFKAIPVGDLKKIQDGMPKEDAEDKSQAIPIMLNVLKDYFLSGKAPGENGELTDVSKEDLNDLDANTAIKCFQALSGVDSNLGSESRSSSSPSTPTESAEAQPLSNT